MYREFPLQWAKVSICWASLWCGRNDLSFKWNIKGLKVLWLMCLSGLCYLIDPEVEKSPFSYLANCSEKSAVETAAYYSNWSSGYQKVWWVSPLSMSPKSLPLFLEAGRLSFPPASGNPNSELKVNLCPWLFSSIPPWANRDLECQKIEEGRGKDVCMTVSVCM